MSDGIRLPGLDELQRVTDLVTGGGVLYSNVHFDLKVKIIDLAIKADLADTLVGIAEDTQDIGTWFRVSRVWEGI